MDHAIQLIQDFEHLAIQLCIAVCTVSTIAHIVRNELKTWLSPDEKRTSKKPR